MEQKDVYKELEEVKHELEMLTRDYQIKSELSLSLRRVNDEQFMKLQEAKVEIEKQSQDINAKEEEISLTRQMYEELKSSFLEKVLAVKHLTAANEGLKTSLQEEVVKSEGEKNELVSSLDEANSEKESKEWLIGAYKEEIKGLKGLLSQSQKKCLDAEQRALVPKELRARDEMILNLEREKWQVEDQLKWRSEQFRHLDEAHHKLQEQFQAKKREWDLEKSKFLDDITFLQMNLDSQTRAVEDLRSKLQMCNEALAHEESRRKLLEIQISELKARYEDVVVEYEEVQSSREMLTAKRDKEIAALRNALATKETHLKEMDFKRVRLEQENEDLRDSLKEFQEAEIEGIEAASPLKTLRQKFRLLEQVHRNCSEILKAKEAAWRKQTKKLGEDLEKCISKSNLKDKQLSELQVELECCHSLLMQQKLECEEITVMLIILEAKFSESCLNLENSELNMEKSIVEAQAKNSHLTEQLQVKDAVLAQARSETKMVQEKVDSLQTRIEHLETFGQECLLMQKELDMYKGVLAESSRSFDCLQEQAFLKESALQEALTKASDALDQTNSALAEKAREIIIHKGMLEELSKSLDRMKEKALERESELQKDLWKTTDALDQANFALNEKQNELIKVAFESQQMRTVLERLEKQNSDLEMEVSELHSEGKETRGELEVALLAKMLAEKALMHEKINLQQITEEKDRIMEKLHQQNILLQKADGNQEFETLTWAEVATVTTADNNKAIQVSEEEYYRLKSSELETDDLEKDYARREAALLDAFQQERENFIQIVKEKENIIAEAQEQITCLESDFTMSVEMRTKLEDKCREVERIYEAVEKTFASYILCEQEMQYKNFLIDELEQEILNIQLQLVVEEKLSLDSKRCIEALEAEIMVARSQKEKEKVKAENELQSMQYNNRRLVEQIEVLKANIKSLSEIISQLSSERQALIGQMVVFSDTIDEVSQKDEDLIKNLENVVHKAHKDQGAVMNSKLEDQFYSNKTDSKNPSSYARSKAEELSERRLPLKEHNC